MADKEVLAELGKNFKSAYSVLKNASKELTRSAIELEKAKREYAKQKGYLHLTGKLDGKNAEIRDAQAADLLIPETIMLVQCEESHNVAKGNFALAKTVIDELEIYLRIAELEVK